MIGLIIASVAALITLIARATTSSLALAQEVQTAGFVNHLSENITNALSIWIDIQNKELTHIIYTADHGR